MTNGPFVTSIPAVPKRRRARFSEDVPVTNEVARAIGHAVVEWGRVEDTAGILTAVLLGADHYDFRAVSTNMMTRGKFDALAAAAKLNLPRRQASTIERIAGAIKGLQGERNRIVHGCWYATKNSNVAERHAYRAYMALEHKEETVSAARIAGHTANVVRLGRRLNYALSRQGFYRPSL